MYEDIGKLGFHNLIGVCVCVFVSVDASPWRADEESIGGEWLNLKKIFVDKLEPVNGFVVDFHIVFHHIESVCVDIVDYVLLEMFA